MGTGWGNRSRGRVATRFGGLVGLVLAAVVAAGAVPVPVMRPAAATRLGAPVLTERAGAVTRIDRNATFAAGVTVAPRPANPFDSAQTLVRMVLRDPSGGRRVTDAYWFQDYTRALVGGREVRTAVGDPYFKARFTPTVAGRWWWRWDVVSPDGHTRGGWHALRVRHRAASPGFLRVSPRDARYLAFDDGTPYFAIGENLGWADQRGTYAYDDWLDQLASQGANWARVWMPAWGMGLEWSDTGLGDYTRRLDRAWQLDHVLESAAARGIAIQLVLQNHGAFSTDHNSEWAGNPYNAANGGPLASPATFMTDSTARDYFLRRVRYVVARYGASTNLLAWELWNEVDLTDGYDSATSAAWHRHAANFIRILDPARHPVTTSFAYFFNDPTVWADAGLDLAQVHFYSQSPGLKLFPDVARVVVDWPAERIGRFGLPTLFSELGVHSAGPAETVATDPQGIGMHDGLWAGAFGGAMGTAMPWWWDNVVAAEPDRYYPMFGAVSGFLQGVPWDTEGFAAGAPALTGGGGRAVRAHLLAGRTQALLWVKDGDYRYDAPARVVLTDVEVSLAGLAEGRWCGGFWNTWGGGFVSLVALDVRVGTMLGAPPFFGDTALRLWRC